PAAAVFYALSLHDALPISYGGQTWVSSGSFIDGAGDFNGDGYTDIALSQIGNYATGTWVTGTYGPVRSSVNFNNGNGRLSIRERSEEHTSELQSRENRVCR